MGNINSYPVYTNPVCKFQNFEETIGFQVKTLLESRPVPPLIRWYNKPGDITKEFWEKTIQFHGTFHGLKITKWIKLRQIYFERAPGKTNLVFPFYFLSGFSLTLPNDSRKIQMTIRSLKTYFQINVLKLNFVFKVEFCFAGGGEEGEVSPALFRNFKMCPNFAKNCPNNIHILFKFLI